MSLARSIILSVVLEGLTQQETAELYGVSKSWVSKLIRRWRLEGADAFEPKSRRPHTTPNQVSDVVTQQILNLRETLTTQGFDAGPHTIAWHLQTHHNITTSVSTIRRRLLTAGLIEPAPKKRPRSSYIRFEADLPNQTWQTDMTHWNTNHLHTELLTFLDDHSRYALSVHAYTTVKTTDVVTQFDRTCSIHGLPASILSDNGLIFTTRFAGHQGGKNRFQTRLAAQGITQKNSRPNRPTTCGKVERFQQTLKKWLRAQPPATTLTELQTQLDTFTNHYNNHRPHRSLNRTTPATAYNLLPKDTPNPQPGPTLRIRHDKVDQSGVVTLRHQGRLHHIGIGRAHKHTRIVLLIDNLDIRIINRTTGEKLRHLTLNPEIDYQPLTQKPKKPPNP